MTITVESIINYYKMSGETVSLNKKMRREIRKMLVRGYWGKGKDPQMLYDFYVSGLDEDLKHHVLYDTEIQEKMLYGGFVRPTTSEMVEFNHKKLRLMWDNNVRYPIYREHGKDQMNKAKGNKSVEESIEVYKEYVNYYKEIMGNNFYISVKGYGRGNPGFRLNGLNRYTIGDIVKLEGITISKEATSLYDVFESWYGFYKVEDMLQFLEDNYKEDWMSKFTPRLTRDSQGYGRLLNKVYI